MRKATWLIATVPITVGCAAGAALAIAGDYRMLEVGIALPALAVAAGAVVSATLAAGLVFVSALDRARARRDAECADAREDGALHEREQHRRFLARLDHELKNPLMAIRAQAAAAEPTDAWETVDAQAAKLSGLVHGLRKLAELDTRPLELEEIDVEMLVRESIAAVEQQHPSALGRFSVTVTRVPWRIPEISGDLDLLSIAVDNVLGNAAKYSRCGDIEVRLREQDGGAVIEVADAGRGIPEQDMPQVFAELARAANARDVPGSGLGLALVRTVVHRHGGEVDIRSVENAGTLVTLTLPLQPR